MGDSSRANFPEYHSFSDITDATGMSVDEVLAMLDIQWEPGREGIEGWAICPCCDERSLHIVVLQDGEAA